MMETSHGRTFRASAREMGWEGRAALLLEATINHATTQKTQIKLIKLITNYNTRATLCRP